MLMIKVLGPGCDNCKKVEVVARRAVGNLALEAEVVKITDYNEIRAYPTGYELGPPVQWLRSRSGLVGSTA